MRKYKIVEVYNEKTVVTSTDSFDEAVLTYQDQIGGETSPARTITFYMKWKDHYVLVNHKAF